MRAESPHRSQVDALFQRAFELEGEERDQLLEAARAEAPDVAAEVVELLRLAAAPAPELGPGALFGGRLWGDLASCIEELDPVQALERIGPYRVLEEIGRGGMGVVYLGARDDGEFDQRVAIKLVPPGAADELVLGRFAQERQILASLDDPHIARLFDGGRHEDGRPYFVMEHVDGVPIDRYCDDHRLSVDERLDLFVQVARAVQHAHGQLVVHRDIKPSNILVTAAGQVKLLDFGIAKVLEVDGVGAVDLTQTAARLLTPHYASPEQVLGRRIGTASDIYQLGLLLFELLTGERAHRISDRTPDTLQRIVGTEPTRRPSDAVGAGKSAKVGALRGTTRPRLRRALEGELDVIVLRALDKEPERRYASAGALADDIERYRSGLPIMARPDTLAYRTRRFAARHQVAVAAGAAFLLLLAGWAVTATLQNARLTEQRDQALVARRNAEEMRDLVFELFREADPFSAQGEDLRALDVVRSGLDVVRSELDDQPLVRAEMLSLLGGIVHQLGQGSDGRGALEEALAILREHESPPGEPTAATLHRLGIALGEAGEREAAEAADRKGLAIRGELYGDGHPRVAESLHALAISLYRQRRYAEAEPLLHEALTIQRAVEPEDLVATAVTMNDVAVMLGVQGKIDEAIAMHRQAIALRREIFPPGHAAIAESANNLGSILTNSDQLAEAEALLREAVEARRRGLGDRHIRVANTLGNLGSTLRRLGSLDEAEAIQREALSIRREHLGDEHHNVAISLHHLGLIQRDRADLGAALDSFRAAVEIFRRARPDAHRRPVMSQIEIGAIETATGNRREAEGLLRGALAEATEHLGADHWVTAVAELELGVNLAAQGNAIVARGHVERAAAFLEEARGRDDELTRRALYVLESL